MADHLASDGFKDVGYEYVNIDVRIYIEIYISTVVHTALVTDYLYIQ